MKILKTAFWLGIPVVIALILLALYFSPINELSRGWLLWKDKEYKTALFNTLKFALLFSIIPIIIFTAIKGVSKKFVKSALLNRIFSCAFGSVCFNDIRFFVYQCFRLL